MPAPVNRGAPPAKAVFSQAATLLIKGCLPGPNWSWIASSKSARVAKCVADDNDYYLKFFLARSRWEPIKAALRGTRCQRAIDEGRRLSAAGFNTPTIVCSGRAAAVDWMVSQGIGAMGLGVYLSNYLRRVRDKKLVWKRRVIRSFGQLVGRLHQAGIVHGDLRLNNVMIDVENTQPRFYLIDNERNKYFPQNIPARLIVKNLVQVNMFASIDITKTDRLRFFQSYQTVFLRARDRRFNNILTQVVAKTQTRMGARLYSYATDTQINNIAVKNIPYEQ